MRNSSSGWVRLAGAALVAGFLIGLPSPVLAQGLAALGKEVWLTRSNCRDCHGSLGNGYQDDPQAPQGYNLRETILSPDEMRDVIRCGRPGGLMPSFQRTAWTDRAPCWGMVADDVGDMIPDKAETALADRLLNALVEMIFAEFVGKPDITQEMCTDFLGQAAARCVGFPAAGN
ncbi:MAG: cytochrome c [Proteobacteria bacterium]|nr:cytochrome c [Pseudomonadota bacterium]MDA1132267.1 cytochrome c [Pseudomonadota bacterium]